MPKAKTEAKGEALADAKSRPDLAGAHVLITAGPTYEAIDPVRFLGNRSSGKMGFALARVAVARGAQVTLVAGPVTLATPDGVRRIDVESAAQMAEAIGSAGLADVIIMAAAVADYRPSQVAGSKLKKEQLGEQPQILLTKNPDILRGLARARTGRLPVLVGFAAETGDLERKATAKLAAKGCDLLVANDVSEAGSGFGTDTNRVILLMREGTAVALPLLGKDEVAAHILDRTVDLLRRARGSDGD